MAQIIDFASRKKDLENKNKTSNTSSNNPVASFLAVAQRNNQAKEKLRKERELANKNVMKSYRIK